MKKIESKSTAIPYLCDNFAVFNTFWQNFELQARAWAHQNTPGHMGFIYLSVVQK